MLGYKKNPTELCRDTVQNFTLGWYICTLSFCLRDSALRLAPSALVI